jgi:hypothetical protein
MSSKSLHEFANCSKNKRFVILSKAKDLLFMYILSVKFAFKSNLLFLNTNRIFPVIQLSETG